MILKTYTYETSWNEPLDTSLDSEQTLLLVFAGCDAETRDTALQELQKKFPLSIIIGSSTAGEINMDELQEDSFVLSVLKFESTRLKLVHEPISSAKESFQIAEKLATALQEKDLNNIFVLSDGLQINGSQLTHGFTSVLGADTIVSGGLAGDGADFKTTWVIVDGKAQDGYVSALGFYGNNIHVSSGFQGGWDKFGIERTVTRSIDNVLYELDDKPALDIYKNYLGDKAKDLPASGLLFPLELQEDENNGVTTVRTILAVNEEEKSITFAGDIPEGSIVSLMKANHDRLIEGAFNASKKVNLSGYNDEEILCIAISCIGRKLVLKQRAEDELEATLENLPPKTKQVGFYSYGEISPLSSGKCDLHNQTMTLTLIWESDAPST